MTASARTVSPDRSARSPNLRLGTEFGAALKAFKGKGIDVKAFDAEWSFMSDKEMSTNLEVFQNNVKAGKTREQAARKTPSGIIADRAGFKEVSVGATTTEADPDIGSGSYPKVRARFSRRASGSCRATGQRRGHQRGEGGRRERAGDRVERLDAHEGCARDRRPDLAIMGANIAFNWIIEAGNEKRIKQSLAKLEPDMLKDSPTADDGLPAGVPLQRRPRERRWAERGGALRGPLLPARVHRIRGDDRWRNEPSYETDASYSFKWIDRR